MAKPNMEEIRANAEAKKSEAKQKIIAVKRDVAERKKLKENPASKYVELPESVGNAEIDSAADLDAVQAGFRKRAKDEGKRFALATDTEYWSCICFQTREQKEAFLGALNLLQFGDKYIDGQLAAKQLGIKLPDADVPYNTSSKIDPKWVEFVE